MDSPKRFEYRISIGEVKLVWLRLDKRSQNAVVRHAPNDAKKASSDLMYLVWTYAHVSRDDQVALGRLMLACNDCHIVLADCYDGRHACVRMLEVVPYGVNDMFVWSDCS